MRAAAEAVAVAAWAVAAWVAAVLVGWEAPASAGWAAAGWVAAATGPAVAAIGRVATGVPAGAGAQGPVRQRSAQRPIPGAATAMAMTTRTAPTPPNTTHARSSARSGGTVRIGP